MRKVASMYLGDHPSFGARKKQLCHKAVFKTEKNIAGTKPGQKYVQACRDEKEKLPSFGASSSLV